MRGSEDFTTKVYAKDQLRTLLGETDFGTLISLMAELAKEDGLLEASEHLYRFNAQDKRPPELSRGLTVQRWK